MNLLCEINQLLVDHAEIFQFRVLDQPIKMANLKDGSRLHPEELFESSTIRSDCHSNLAHIRIFQ